MLLGRSSKFEFHFLICLLFSKGPFFLGPYFPPVSIILIHQFSCFSLWSVLLGNFSEKFIFLNVYRANELMSTRQGHFFLTDSNYFGSSKGILHITLANPGKIRSQVPKSSSVANSGDWRKGDDFREKGGAINYSCEKLLFAFSRASFRKL